MKKILFIILALTLWLNAHGQSLSVKDMANIVADGDNAKELLTSKSFKQVGLSAGPLVSYVKNSHTNQEEKIYLSETSVSYLTKNKDYINNLLKQLQKGFHLISKDDNPSYKFFQFQDSQSQVSVNIPAGTTGYCTITTRGK